MTKNSSNVFTFIFSKKIAQSINVPSHFHELILPWSACKVISYVLSYVISYLEILEEMKSSDISCSYLARKRHWEGRKLPLNMSITIKLENRNEQKAKIHVRSFGKCLHKISVDKRNPRR